MGDFLALKIRGSKSRLPPSCFMRSERGRQIRKDEEEGKEEEVFDLPTRIKIFEAKCGTKRRRVKRAREGRG